MIVHHSRPLGVRGFQRLLAEIEARLLSVEHLGPDVVGVIYGRFQNFVPLCHCRLPTTSPESEAKRQLTAGSSSELIRTGQSAVGPVPAGVSNDVSPAANQGRGELTWVCLSWGGKRKGSFERDVL